MTLRRTSRPRTGKHIDPTNKGKGKERRPIEEEADFGSDTELKEALRKVKEDERKAELYCKRGEDALRFHVVPDMKERFFKGTRNQSFNEERQFNLNRIKKYFPDIIHNIKERYWEIFTLPPGRYRPTFVHEFYASYGAAKKHQKENGPLRLRPCLEKVKVRGVKVDCRAKAINWAYFDDADADATKCFAKMENPEDYYT
ncbi:hypothetical protein HAX54_046208 [Datura stramonium]|uniref:Putative plant transposon protein domain-containing protein n=1 Tax=Datura stramonium TaxID=4076 RepID=A0ABS8SRW0_DATST|nr:hypothetical protein [Datura stramonium]